MCRCWACASGPSGVAGHRGLAVQCPLPAISVRTMIHGHICHPPVGKKSHPSRPSHPSSQSRPEMALATRTPTPLANFNPIQLIKMDENSIISHCFLRVSIAPDAVCVVPSSGDLGNHAAETHIWTRGCRRNAEKPAEKERK